MLKSDNKAVIGLSWEPKLPLFSEPSSTSSGSRSHLAELSSSVYLSNSELIEGLYVPPKDPKKLDTSGKNWCHTSIYCEFASRFDSPAPTITPELKKDIQLLKLRVVIDPKRHYKKRDSKSKSLPKYFQVGTVIESASEFYTGRLTKKERKATLADELLSDTTFAQYRKRKVKEIEEHNQPAAVDKWKRIGRQSRKRAKQRKH